MSDLSKYLYYDRDGITIYCGDCREILPLLDVKVDLVVTSPPYDNLRFYNGYQFDFENIALALWNVLSLGAVLIWVAGDQSDDSGESGTSFRQCLHFKDIGFRLHDVMIYEKNGASYPSHDKYYQTFEYMFVLTKGRPRTVNLLTDRRNLWDGSWGKRSRRDVRGNLILGDKTPSNELGVRWNIWRYNVGEFGEEKGHGGIHPAVFPYALARDHILSWSTPNDLVLDPMMGVATTLIAAKQLNRKAIGIEISEEYCKIAVQRLSQEVMRLE